MRPFFQPATGPRVFTLPPGVDFSRALVAGLDERLDGQPPEAAARITIWVNTERTRRKLNDLFASGPARVLPRIRIITELASDPLVPVTFTPAPSALARKLDLARLVSQLIASNPGMAAETAAFDLADSLADLLDELEGEGIDPASLSDISLDDHAAHWQQSLRFLNIIRDYAAESAMSDGQGRQRASALALSAEWARTPPAHPVIVAGSTGSRTATRLFMMAVSRLPQGALILPGFDRTQPKSCWEHLDGKQSSHPDHPQYGFRKLADALGADPYDLPVWHDRKPFQPERNRLISLALRPAPVTDSWRKEGGELRGTLGAALDKLTWLEAPDQRSEARAIAWSLRNAAGKGLSAALITPDRTLSRRVTAELDRWRLIPDDSAGRPLALTPPGVLLRCLADPSIAQLTPGALLVLLKHPLVNSGDDARGRHLKLTGKLETERLRGGAPVINWHELHAWAAEGDEQAPAWIRWLEDSLTPLAGAGSATLAERVEQHRSAAEMLAAGPDADPDHGLWQRDAGKSALAMIEEIASEADAWGDIRPVEYQALLNSQLAQRDVPEEAAVTHANIAIWGTLEARVQTADLVILGGLNEGIWPKQPQPDPWLSRPLRQSLGLPSPDLHSGLSAHDFQQATGASDVIMSRAVRDAEAPTIASRWLLRLENLLGGLGEEGKLALQSSKERGQELLSRSEVSDLLAKRVAPAPRPSPRPPVWARPGQLSVTQIETLVRDPYEIYARKVLKLKALDAPGCVADALSRGSTLHAALEDFVDLTKDGLGDNVENLFSEAIARAVTKTVPWPAIRVIWSERLSRSADWFIAGERKRRERGHPLGREVWGKRTLNGVPEPFEVSAKADRIDQDSDGNYAIYDYKSGNVPAASRASRFHLQLPLEAAIAESGGFTGLAASRTTHMELIGLNSQNTLELDASPDAIAAKWAELSVLISRYMSPEQGFTARLRPGQLNFPGDYEHLSRWGEWSDGDAPEDQG